MFVYAIRGGAYAKVGVSDDIERRMAGFNRGGLPFEVHVVCLGDTDTVSALRIEMAILDLLPGRLRGEWVDGAIPDADLIRAFGMWPWLRPLLVAPTAQQIADANRAGALHRQLAASTEVAAMFDAERLPRAEVAVARLDWHKTASVLVESGDKTGLRRLRKAFKAKRLAAQNRARA